MKKLTYISIVLLVISFGCNQQGNQKPIVHKSNLSSNESSDDFRLRRHPYDELQGIVEHDFVGFWQKDFDHIVSDRWGEVIQFYSNRRFILNNSECDCARRVDGYQGDYAVEGNNLILFYCEYDTLVGGHYQKTYDGCTDSALVKYSVKSLSYKFPKREVFSFSGIIIDTIANRKRLSMKLDSITYYKISDDPTYVPNVFRGEMQN